jgi:hypothetical protein
MGVEPALAGWRNNDDYAQSLGSLVVDKRQRTSANADGTPTNPDELPTTVRFTVIGATVPACKNVNDYKG